MNKTIGENCKINACSHPAEQLNRSCFCKTFDSNLLKDILSSNGAYEPLLQPYNQFFSNTAVFISREQLHAIQRLIAAIEQVIALPSYQSDALSRAPKNAQVVAHNAGVFMGYDFHLTDSGPQLIEINTNAGGGFLNAVLAHSQMSCCTQDAALYTTKQQLDAEFIDMFSQEWRSLGNERSLKTVAIVDDNPQQQFLYREFTLAQGLFEQRGISAFIAAPEELIFDGRYLNYKNHVIDLVYNRLTDFSLTDATHQAIFSAFECKAILLTPTPYHHALYADKRNLVSLSDAAILENYGADKNIIGELINGIPTTRSVTAENADELWQKRKQLFFKPTDGFASRATYRGEKITQRVWQEILNGKYIAQKLVRPSERGMLVDGLETSLKTDIRAYVYKGKIQLLAARLYQGQTTNFRTVGGGFAPVFIHD